MKPYNYTDYGQDEQDYKSENHYGDENIFEEKYLLNDNNYLDNEFSNELESDYQNNLEDDFEEDDLDEDTEDEYDENDWEEEEEEEEEDEDSIDDYHKNIEPQTFTDDSLKID